MFQRFLEFIAFVSEYLTDGFIRWWRDKFR